MKKLFLVGTLLFSAALMFTGCEKKKDNQKPKINLTAPKDDAVLFIGRDVHFEVEFTDNEALNAYKVNIHENMTHPHSHEASLRAAAEDSVYFEKTWQETDFQKIAQEKGQSFEFIRGMKSKSIHHHYLEIPAQYQGKPVREGNYHFMIYCTDVNGNESYVSRDVVLKYPKEGEDDDHDHDHDHDHEHHN